MILFRSVKKKIRLSMIYALSNLTQPVKVE